MPRVPVSHAVTPMRAPAEQSVSSERGFYHRVRCIRRLHDTRRPGQRDRHARSTQTAAPYDRDSATAALCGSWVTAQAPKPGDNFHCGLLGAGFGAGFAPAFGTEPVCASGVAGFASARLGRLVRGRGLGITSTCSPGLDFSSAVAALASPGLGFPLAVDGFASCGLWIFRPPVAFASTTAGCSRHVLKRASSSVPWSFHQTSSNLSAFLKLSGAVGRKPFISMSMDGCLPTSAIADLRIGP